MKITQTEIEAINIHINKLIGKSVLEGYESVIFDLLLKLKNESKEDFADVVSSFEPTQPIINGANFYDDGYDCEPMCEFDNGGYEGFDKGVKWLLEYIKAQH